ncbi:MAG: beta-Ig-H3/fasciclin [Phycisphaerae bacterium]|nr:beta-Ig-H3/fasciclin [Phycisphaerae bacterium]|tara:strand:+ start:1480 stop:2409 length:930 start_codon:yes stop_codon:yes gene_type:complete
MILNPLIITAMTTLGQCSASNNTMTVAVSKAPTIAQAAVSQDQFSTLVAALKAADLVETLDSEGHFTVFAPTNDAFAALPDGTIPALLKAENKGQLTNILTYHVVPADMSASKVIAADGSKTVNGQWVDFSYGPNGAFVDNARITTTDIKCSNGTIHIIDRVILPSEKNIVATASDTGTFNTLLAAAKAAGLARNLGQDGPYTIFAPTDDAFARLGNETIAELLLPENKDKLARILGNHVVSGRIYSPDAMAAGQATTLAGTNLKIKMIENNARVGNANLLLTDIDASNGVIHVIDTVLIPTEEQARLD